MRTAFLSFLLVVVLGCDQPSAQVGEDVRVSRVGDGATPIAEGKLGELRAAAERTHSDAVVITRDGETVAEWYFGEDPRPIELMSVVKSVVSLGVGHLLMGGRIDSLDQPVHAFYPEWKQGRKRQITIRHLLTHTSGLQNVPNTTVEIYPSPDAVRLALAAEVWEEPGSAFRYNNKAVNLLSGIIEEASGQRMDRFFEEAFFGPMGIEEYAWGYDPSGRPYAMAGLALHARDLAKFGQLVLDGGTWEGERLVSEAYVEEMLAQGQPHSPLHGLLWWRLPRGTRFTLDETRLAELAAAGVAPADLATLQPLAGRTFTTRDDVHAAFEEVWGPRWREVHAERFQSFGVNPVFRVEHDDIAAYYGDGYLGQTLLVVPEHGLVAVRQVRGGRDYNAETDGFEEFKELALELVQESEE
jgi:CubicO group peptidase (beta-lactamase class C family)